MKQAMWIHPAEAFGDAAPVYIREFSLSKPVQKAVLTVTAMGVYEAQLNGKTVGDFVLAPGWTTYFKRLQYQTYDITDLLEGENRLQVTVGKGWYHTHLMCWHKELEPITETPLCLLAKVEVTYTDGSREELRSDENWVASHGPVQFAEIYDGEHYDARIEPNEQLPVAIYAGPYDTLIPQEGEEVTRQERLAVAKTFVTPKGEVVMDFGQNMTGVVALSLEAKAGEKVDLSFAEVMDKEGNFYTENYRGAKCRYVYTCREGKQTFEPVHTFYGFRYIRVNQFPGGPEKAKPENFTGVVLHSNMKRTGYLRCSEPLLNRLFENIIWGQKSNFLDVPTDCPQRDERFGWTGDAQVFGRTACLNYDAEKFFTKWLADLIADQCEDGGVGEVIPDWIHKGNSSRASAAWGDVATILPWQLYLAYGNKGLLERQFESMHKWVDYITKVTTTPGLWTGQKRHFGDWLGLDAPAGSYKGSSRDEFIATAFYAYSTELVIKAGKVLGKDVSYYEKLYDFVVASFREHFPVYHTQTECVLAAWFRLDKNPQAPADQLAKMVRDDGMMLRTGFVGTPYLLHTLSHFGYTDMAYTLLLRREYPGWLFSVRQGATTIWEHWDGVNENGDFWSRDMNSFNHYAYGSVADWVYCVAAGIQTLEEYPGYEKIRIAPVTDKRLEWLEAELETRHGYVRSCWRRQDGMWRYDITTPVETEIVINGKRQIVPAGSYCFYSPEE